MTVDVGGLAGLADVPGTAGDWVAVAAVLTILVVGRRTVGGSFALLCAALAVAAFVVIGNPALPVTLAAVLVSLAAAARLSGTRYRRGGGPFAREAALIVGGLLIYTALRLIESDPEPAFANTARVMWLEQRLGLDFEPALQAWVLRSELLTRGLNWVYSFAFLAVTAWALLWLWFVDPRNYRLLRNTLGVSALLAIVTIAAFPVAPPRLVEGSGLVDTVVLFGRQHGFANEYAAVPSLHVGWMAAVGFVLATSIGGRRGVLIGWLPAALMTVTVIATGNHLFLDGVIGAAYALGAAVVLSSPATLRAWRWLGGSIGPARASLEGLAAQSVSALSGARARFTLLSLSGLLVYLITEQIVHPGFTDFWGYLVGQVGVILILLIGCEVVFEREGGLSWLTHGVAVVCCYADVLGTDGNLYAAIDEYDKLTHFAGVAALTAGVFDGLGALNARGRLRQSVTARAWLSVGVGVAIGIGWEIYELLGDKVFHTARVYGPWDTSYDVLSDAMGALTVAVLLWARELQSAPRRRTRSAEGAGRGPLSIKLAEGEEEGV